MEKLVGLREDNDVWEEDPEFVEMPDRPQVTARAL
jgi:hypothetical protein